MTQHGKLVNKNTGETLSATETRQSCDGRGVIVTIDGTDGYEVYFNREYWDFIRDPEPVKDGYYLRWDKIYLVHDRKVTFAPLMDPGKAVLTSFASPQDVAQGGKFLGDLEGNHD